MNKLLAALVAGLFAVGAPAAFPAKATAPAKAETASAKA